MAMRLLSELLRRPARTNLAVIMAGGLGSRLGELTAATPKPLLTVGDRPIIGTIVGQLVQHGFSRIVVAVNHLAEQIEAYVLAQKSAPAVAAE